MNDFDFGIWLKRYSFGFEFCVFTLQNGIVWIMLGLLLVFTKMVLFVDDLAKIKQIGMHMCYLMAKTNRGV